VSEIPDFGEPGCSERDIAGHRISAGPLPLCAECYLARYPDNTFAKGEYPPRTCTSCGRVTNHGLVG
jgi:hypothetical protein